MDMSQMHGVSEELCRASGTFYYQKLFTAVVPSGKTSGLVLLLNGLGLDREAFLPFLQYIGLPSVRLPYPYKTYAHLAPTVAGFEPSEEPTAENLLSMEEQAKRMALFLRERVEEMDPERVVLYSFSYGSDLMIPILEMLLEDHRIQPLLSRAVVAEINVSQTSCFISSRIKGALEGMQDLPGGPRMREAHQHFFQDILRAYTAGELSTSLMAALAQYFAVTITKNWHQLAFNCQEVTAAPEAQLQKLLGLLKWLPSMDLDLVFSDKGDLAAMDAVLAQRPVPLPRLRLFDATQVEHFHHMAKEGVLANLTRAHPEHLPA